MIWIKLFSIYNKNLAALYKVLKYIHIKLYDKNKL